MYHFRHMRVIDTLIVGGSLNAYSPHYHCGNGMTIKTVGISRKMLRKSKLERNLLRDQNSTLGTGFKSSPAQIWFSRCVRTNIPVSLEALNKFKVQKSIYETLMTKQEHDMTARRKVTS
ncbi:hypothetical protein PR048_020466 [Dryococelus australis]|uniref:Uncharacterized protein n=1 Tax=Dryococelus australis TaxID=614101 RepID=A0ABQ9H6C6_9NEOP|nr:hypothetical protein PR048_020466 [Dryococelus australis]